MAFEKQGIKPVPYEVRYPKGSGKSKKTKGEKIRENLKKFKSNEDKKKKRLEDIRKELGMKGGGTISKPRAMYRKGGGVCLRGMNREAVGKNS
jgi:hypothetical protein